jgi:hypothetical protein
MYNLETYNKNTTIYVNYRKGPTNLFNVDFRLYKNDHGASLPQEMKQMV